VLESFLEPIRERRAYWEDRPNELTELLAAGTAAGRGVVTATLRKVLDAVGLPNTATTASES
jgi:tryptophanyl-tRNA synthetase